MGSNELRNNITNETPNAAKYCLFDKQHKFDYYQCKQFIYNKLKTQNLIADLNFPLQTKMPITGFCGYYYQFKFLNINKFTEIANAITKQCHNKSLSTISRNHPATKKQYLPNNCFNSVYVDTLLNNIFNIPSKYPHFSASENLDWALGAALYLNIN